MAKMDVVSIIIWMLIFQETIDSASSSHPSTQSLKQFPNIYPSSHTSNSFARSRTPIELGAKTSTRQANSRTPSLPSTQIIPGVITRLSSIPSRVTGTPKPSTSVTPPTPGVVTSGVVTRSSDTRILKKGFNTIEGLLLMIVVLVAAIAGSLTTWFLMKLRRSRNERSSKGYEAVAVGHI